MLSARVNAGPHVLHADVWVIVGIMLIRLFLVIVIDLNC